MWGWGGRVCLLNEIIRTVSSVTGRLTDGLGLLLRSLGDGGSRSVAGTNDFINTGKQASATPVHEPSADTAVTLSQQFESTLVTFYW